MTKFDSIRAHGGDQMRSDDSHTNSSMLELDMSKLSLSENKTLSSNPAVATGLHHLEIAGATVGAPTAIGAVGGIGMGLAAEGLVQAYKFPAAGILQGLGAHSMAADLVSTETRYLTTAGKFGAKGAALGVAFGAAIFAGYETKKYLDEL